MSAPVARSPQKRVNAPTFLNLRVTHPTIGLVPESMACAVLLGLAVATWSTRWQPGRPLTKQSDISELVIHQRFVRAHSALFADGVGRGGLLSR
jgi:hypothetical protein